MRLSYVRLKHTLSEICLDAVVRGRTAPVAWLDGYARLATPGSVAVPLDRLRAEAAEAEEGLRLLLRRGVLAHDGETISLAPAFAPHLRYLQQVAPRLVAALARLPAEIDRGLDPTVAAGVALFNSGLYFECHEYFESVWREAPPEEREFFHGLIQAAAAFYHFEKGNLHGARQLLDRAMRRLPGYEPVHLNVDVASLVASLTRWQDVFARSGRPRPRPTWAPQPIERRAAPRITSSPQEK